MRVSFSRLGSLLFMVCLLFVFMFAGPVSAVSSIDLPSMATSPGGDPGVVCMACSAGDVTAATTADVSSDSTTACEERHQGTMLTEPAFAYWRDPGDPMAVITYTPLQRFAAFSGPPACGGFGCMPKPPI